MWYKKIDFRLLYGLDHPPIHTQTFISYKYTCSYGIKIQFEFLRKLLNNATTPTYIKIQTISSSTSRVRPYRMDIIHAYNQDISKIMTIICDTIPPMRQILAKKKS